MAALPDTIALFRLIEDALRWEGEKIGRPLTIDERPSVVMPLRAKVALLRDDNGGYGDVIRALRAEYERFYRESAKTERTPRLFILE